MRFTSFPEANDVLRAAPGTEAYVQDLAIFRPAPYVVSCVALDDDEVAAVLTMGRIYLQVVGHFEPQHLPYLAQLAILADFPQGTEGTPLFCDFEGSNAGFPLNGATVPAFLQPLAGQELLPETHPCAVVCFALTDADMAHLLATRQLYVRALGATHPPIAVHATNPIRYTAPVAEEAATPA